MYDLIIIGAGPAGLTAGIYARRFNLKTLIIEKESIGGQIASAPLVENYPGFNKISGAELANNFYEQYIDLGGDLEIAEVLKIDTGKEKTVVTDSGDFTAKSIIIATGAKYRHLGIDREDELLGKGIHFCATCDGSFYKDKTVAVIGGANTAVSSALYLSAICKKVYLIYRKDKLRCESSLIKDLSERKNIEVLYNSVVESLVGEELNKIIINSDGIKKELEVSGVFVSIGHDASTNLVKDVLDLDDGGYIISSTCNTKLDGVFVAGDCRSKKIRQLTTAVSDGTVAAMAAIDYLKGDMK